MLRELKEEERLPCPRPRQLIKYACDRRSGAARGREGDFRPTVFLNYPAVDDLIAHAGPPRNGRETFEPSTPGVLSPRLNTRLNTVEYAYDSGRGTRVREIMLVRSIIPRQTLLGKQQPVWRHA